MSAIHVVHYCRCCPVFLLLHGERVTTEGVHVSVPHLMSRRTKATLTTARRYIYCGVFRDSGAEYKTADLLNLLFAAHNTAQF